MSIESNVACTKAVREFIELGEDLAGQHDVRRFWAGVAAAANDRAGLTKELKDWTAVDRLAPMTDEEAKAFGRTKIDFGKHAGKAIDEVPLDYLRWMSEQAAFQIKLRRYFESDRVQREIDA